MPESKSDFDKGKDAGNIEQRLKEHDRRLDIINGSIEKTAQNLASLDTHINQIATRDEINTAVKESVLSTFQRRVGYAGLAVVAFSSLYTAIVK